MDSDDSLWTTVTLAAAVVIPGLIALACILHFRSWLWRSRFRSNKRRAELVKLDKNRD